MACASAHLLDQSETIEPRHVDVGNDDIDLVDGKPFERDNAVIRLGDIKAVREISAWFSSARIEALSSTVRMRVVFDIDVPRFRSEQFDFAAWSRGASQVVV